MGCAYGTTEATQTLHPTVYYKPIYKAYDGQCGLKKTQILSPQNKLLAEVCEDQFNSCVMQGSCAVYDEAGRLRSFNYYARGADGLPRFFEVDSHRCPYGYGAHLICLDPYFTVAADLSIYKLGDVIFVPRAVGEIMPDGQTHHGYFVVRDSGAAIKGPLRFDFFTGFTKPFAKENPFSKMGFADKSNSFEFRLATAEEAQQIRERTKFPEVQHEIFIPPR